MTRDEAVQRAREAMEAWERNTYSPSRFTQNMADALRDLLAVEVEPTEMHLCEIPHLGLHADQLYIFRHDPTCVKCNAVATGHPTKVEPSEAVKRCKEAAKAVAKGPFVNVKEWRAILAAIEALPDTLAPVLTEKDARTVEWARKQWVYETGSGARFQELLAIIDRLCRPEPKHKPCPFCGCKIPDMSEYCDRFWAWCPACGVS